MPQWVLILYLILFLWSLRLCFKSVGHIIRIIIFPAIFGILAWWNFMLASIVYTHGLWLWLIGGFIGLTEGLISTKKLGLRADKKRWRLELPGSLLMLSLTGLLFLIEYSIYYIEATAIPALKAKIFLIISITASGWIAGLVIGRHLNYLHKFIKAAHTDLK